MELLLEMLATFGRMCLATINFDLKNIIIIRIIPRYYPHYYCYYFFSTIIIIKYHSNLHDFCFVNTV